MFLCSTLALASYFDPVAAFEALQYSVEKGQIVQKGTHEQLMKQEGIYKRFVDAREQAVSWKLAR